MLDNHKKISYSYDMLFDIIDLPGEVPERSKGTDCKSVGNAFVGSNPTLATILRSSWSFVWHGQFKAKINCFRHN